MVLSVNRKTSRLAVLGELGRHPMLIKALSQCINYKMSLISPAKPASLITSAVTEMQTMASAGVDCWLTRVNKIQSLLDIPNIIRRKNGSGKKITSMLKSKFEIYWLDRINETKTGNDQLDHNKLRTYRSYKASFDREPYLDLVRNRNQRLNLSRLRTGSHNLGVERGRWTRPVTPLDQRVCIYCLPESCTPPASTTPTCRTPSCTPLTCTSPTCPPPQSPTPQVDTEQHFLINCKRFSSERNVTYLEMSKLVPNFMNLSEDNKFKTLLCPTTPQSAKITSKFIKLMFQLRENIDKNNIN